MFIKAEKKEFSYKIGSCKFCQLFNIYSHLYGLFKKNRSFF